MSKIFILEDDPERIRQFSKWFDPYNKAIQWDCIHTCERVDDFKPPYDYIFLDHDLGGSQLGYKHGRPLSVQEAEDCGLTFVKLVGAKLQQHQPSMVVLHSYNPDGARNMAMELRGWVKKNVIIAPFGTKDFMYVITAIQESVKND